MDMLDMLDQMDYRHFKKETYRYLLNSFPQRQESGCDSEVNFLFLSEVTTKSISMKLRRSTVLRDRGQQPKHVDDPQSISVVLSDTDSNQSSDAVEITDHVSITRPVRKTRTGRSRKDEWPLSIDASQHGGVQKISLAPGVMAEDTLGSLRLMCDESEAESRPISPVESRGEIECFLDDSSSDVIQSGPSSPCHPIDTVRCRKCESLFARMRKHPTPKKKSRDKNPASLSCDVWVLLKKRHPQRHRHREKGLLWTSLSHIRKLSAQGSYSAAINRTQTNCSRPHVFQERNLRRCKCLSSIHTNVSITKAKSRFRKRQRAGDWPPIVAKKSKVKRKPSMNNTLSKQHFSLDLSVREAQEKEAPVEHKTLRLNADLKQNSDASSKQRSNVRAKSHKQEESDGIDGTRRVLKFDDTPETVAVETAEQRKSPRQQQEHREIRKAQDVVLNEQQEELCKVSDGFRTPTDVFSMKPKIKPQNQKKVSASADTKPAAKKPNFMSLLATMVRKQNQIIKESSK